jgi:hypothetical protein
MKKQVLLGVALGIGCFAIAQNAQPSHSALAPAKLKPSVSNRSEIYHKNQIMGADNVSAPAPSFSSLVNAIKHEQSGPSRAYTTTNIGNTGYQLQTNAAICNRVVKSPDGTISVTWTYSNQQASWTDRGTGYNYFNGTSWGAAPTVRIENTRTGFTNIGITQAGAEVVVSHEASNIHVSQRPAKGTGAWSDAALGFPDLWSRLAVGGANGQTLHVISQTASTGGPVAYSRSLDGGTTWDISHYTIPEIDASQYLMFGGDTYSIDAKGDTVVIVLGDLDIDVVMLKSIDNGTTWTKTIVHPFPIPLFDGASMDTDLDLDGLGDTLATCDGSVNVLLDHQGMAHVWYGKSRVLEDPGAGALSYFRGTDALMYWHEGMCAPVEIAYAEDIDGDGALTVTDWGRYRVSMTSFPSSGIDAAGTLYVSYASVWEGDADNGAPGDGLSYTHTYVMSSPDNGATWCMPIDVTDPAPSVGYTEGVYGAMSKDVDGFVHLFVQTDGAVGNGLTVSSDNANPDPQSGSADILYKKIPVADVNTCASSGTLCMLTTSVNDKPASLSSMELYPNPASSVSNLEMNVATKGNVSVKIINVTGQVISEVSNQEYAAGKYNISIDLSKLQSGIYMINMTSNDGVVTKKMIVK